MLKYSLPVESAREGMSSIENSNLPSHLVEHLKNVAKTEGFLDDNLNVDISLGHIGGFMASTLKLALIGNREQNGKTSLDKLSLIVKSLPVSESQRLYFGSDLLFEREVYFYNEIIPILTEFQEKLGLSEDNGFFAYPHCYLAIYDTDTPIQSVIIMADLRTSGFEVWNNAEEISFETVQLIMVSLGRFHAISFVVRDQQPDLFKKFHSLSDVLQTTIKNEVLQEMFVSTFNLALDNLSDEIDIQIMHRIKNEWLTMSEFCLQFATSEPFSVIGHGDCWNNNLMFRFDENVITALIY